MSEKSFTRVKKGVVKRRRRRTIGVFIDGSSLDRATRRMQRRIDLPRLVQGVSAGGTPTVARYYTLIPHEDDSRQRAFLDAVRRAGLEVVVKRLPPKGITRQVTVEVEMASDMIAFGLGQNEFQDIGYSLSENYEGSRFQEERSSTETTRQGGPAIQLGRQLHSEQAQESSSEQGSGESSTPIETTSQNVDGAMVEEERIVTVVCAARALTYPFRFLRSQGIQTVSADFAETSGKELLKSASKWIDLSDSETIWRDE
ncbi:NYN domain-containing protein [bacterium]|nr:NYN domain-containing protein [bacterium]